MSFSSSSAATEWRPKITHGKTVGFVVKTSQAPERGGRLFWRSIFCRPIRGLHIIRTNNPTVSPWATFFRASGALTAMILFFAAGATAETTNTFSDAEIQGRALAQQLCDAQPAGNFTNTGVLLIRNSKGETTKVPLDCFVFVAQTNWINFYVASRLEGSFHSESIGYSNSFTRKFPIEITHFQNRLSIYKFKFPSPEPPGLITDLYIPFAGSDFSIGDLGLEFFHWPQQKILPHTTNLKRGRSYTLLESTNPNPTTNGYSRVLSWIDKESGGILEAEAYDFNGKLLKNFAPKSFKKVNGQWELQEMEIRNVQTGSRTRLEFDLKK